MGKLARIITVLSGIGMVVFLVLVYSAVFVYWVAWIASCATGWFVGLVIGSLLEDFSEDDD